MRERRSVIFVFGEERMTFVEKAGGIKCCFPYTTTHGFVREPKMYNEAKKQNLRTVEKAFSTVRKNWSANFTLQHLTQLSNKK